MAFIAFSGYTYLAEAEESKVPTSTPSMRRPEPPSDQSVMDREKIKQKNRVARITCPITQQIFCEPVRLPIDPECYVERAIAANLTKHPLTQEPFSKTLNPSELMTSQLIKDLVVEYIEEFPDAKSEQYGYEAHSMATVPRLATAPAALTAAQPASAYANTSLQQPLVGVPLIQQALQARRAELSRQLDLSCGQRFDKEWRDYGNGLACGASIVTNVVFVSSACSWSCLGPPLVATPCWDMLAKTAITFGGSMATVGLSCFGFFAVRHCRQVQADRRELAEIDRALGAEEQEAAAAFLPRMAFRSLPSE